MLVHLHRGKPSRIARLLAVAAFAVAAAASSTSFGATRETRPQIVSFSRGQGATTGPRPTFSFNASGFKANQYVFVEISTSPQVNADGSSSATSTTAAS